MYVYNQIICPRRIEMPEEIKLTALVKGDIVEIFADVFPDDKKQKFAYTAKFERRALWAQDTGESMLSVSVEEARRFAKEILRDTEGD